MKFKQFKFIDLFSGIGAFNIALKNCGGECVFASEIDPYAIETYKQNFHIDSNYDITNVNEKDIPKHDVLCAGFPCQAFSTAGKKLGFSDERRGNLFFEIIRILNYHKTKFIILENVEYLLRHDDGRTFKKIYDTLKETGYILTKEPIILSPHNFGIPQHRKRIFILGVYKDYCNDEYLDIDINIVNKLTSINSILEKKGVDSKYSISEYEEKVFCAWNEFYKRINKKIYGFPVWVDEFGQNYSIDKFPKWKQIYCIKNRNLYLENKDIIDKWLNEFNVKDFKLRDRKFEWQAGTECKSVWETIIQFRQSGVRFKRPNYFPALVAIVQTPIVGKLKRRITPREAARLQSFPETFIINKIDDKAYKQFGNSANVKIIEYLAKKLFNKYN